MGDEERFPTMGINGGARVDQRMIRLRPRGMEITTNYRIAGVNNFEGSLAHELAHFIQDYFLTHG